MIFITVSTGHFDPLVMACNAVLDKYDFFGQIGSGTFVPRFPHVRTLSPEDLDRKLAEAELVISHGGTGMLSRLYRLKKRVVVVPKQVRYGEANDSQVELAKRWAELGMAVLCLDVAKIQAAIRLCRETAPRFPDFPPLGERLRECVGLERRGGVAGRTARG